MAPQSSDRTARASTMNRLLSAKSMRLRIIEPPCERLDGLSPLAPRYSAEPARCSRPAGPAVFLTRSLAFCLVDCRQLRLQRGETSCLPLGYRPSPGRANGGWRKRAVNVL